MATREYQFIVGPETPSLPAVTDPSTDNDLLTKGYCDKTYTRGVDAVATLKAVDTRTDNQTVWVDALQAFFYFDSASSATGDDVQVITPTSGTGRWVRVPTKDTVFRIVDASDSTLMIDFNATGTTGTKTTITTAQTANRVVTMPDATTTLVGHDATQTLTNKTIVAASNTITTAASGNLAATSLNAALAELQTDIDTRATTTALSNHEADTTSIHGITDTSLLVTTDGTQTVTNKTISGASNTITNVSLSTGVTGTLPIGNGGTGQTSANAALNALLPSQASASGKVLQSNGTDAAWQTVSATAAGSAGQLQFNVGGALGADSQLHWDNTSKRFGIGSSGSFKFLVYDSSLTGTTASSNVIAKFTSNGTGYDAAIQLADNTGGYGNIGMLGSALYFAPAGSERVRINSTGLGIGTSSPTNTLDVNGTVRYRRSVVTLANGTNNNVSAMTTSFVSISGPTGVFTVTGIVAGEDGQMVTLYNPTGNAMTIANDSASSTAANRILTTTFADITTSGPGTVTLFYSANESRWIVVSYNL